VEEAVEAVMQVGGPGAFYITVGRAISSSSDAAETLLRRRLVPLEGGKLWCFDIRGARHEMRGERKDVFRLECSDMKRMLQESKVAPAGVLVDLGVQLTGAEEKNIGLSYFEAVPLDGRFDPSRGVSAKTWLQNVSVNELTQVLMEGEDWLSNILAQRLAEAILARQAQFGPYRSTLELAEVICSVKGSDDRGMHPAKMTFQAIRSYLNKELSELRFTLTTALESLQLGGRLIVVTLRRKEATEVKKFLRNFEAPDLRYSSFVTPQRMVELFPLAATLVPYSCRQLCEPIRASVDQVTRNPRAKVALVHVLQKEARSLESCKKLGLIGLTPRPLSEQFKKPTVLPLSSGTSA